MALPTRKLDGFPPPRAVQQAFAEGPRVEVVCRGHGIEHGLALSISFLQEIILDSDSQSLHSETGFLL